MFIIQMAFDYLSKKEDELKNADSTLWELDDEINELKKSMKNAKTEEEKQGYKSQIDYLENERQKRSDYRAGCYETKCYAEGELEKTLQKYGYEGKTLEEIKAIMDSLQIDIDKLVAQNEDIYKTLEEIHSKYQETFGHSV